MYLAVLTMRPELVLGLLLLNFFVSGLCLWRLEVHGGLISQILRTIHKV